MSPSRRSFMLAGLVTAVVLAIGACAPREQAVTYLPPPPDAGLRPLSPPLLETADRSNPGDPADYPDLIADLLAIELAPIFGLPAGADTLVQHREVANLVPVLDAVTGEIVIPMLFDALDPRQKAVIAKARPWISLGDREPLYRLIVDIAMARVWQIASGDNSHQAGYLQHLAARPNDRGEASFIAWRGLEGAIWQRRIEQHLQPSDRPFAVLGMMTSHYLHTHIFAITGYLVARNFADALIEHGHERLDVDRLTAALMDRADLPLMGIDTLFAIAEERQGATRSCRSWRFFGAAERRLQAEAIEASLRDQESAVGRRFSAFLPGHTETPVRFAGFDVDTWRTLLTEPVGCAGSEVAGIALPVPLVKRAAAPSGRACETVLTRADAIEDDRLRTAFCRLADKAFPDEARDLLLAHIADGRRSAAERSAIVIGLGLLQARTIVAHPADPSGN